MVQAFGPVTLGLVVASLAASAGGVWVSIRLARHAGAMDIPNERSSHSVPTPRVGGVPMVAAAVLAFGCWAFLSSGGSPVPKGLQSTVLFALGMALLGLWDDLSSLSPLFRFIVQIVWAGAILGGLAALFPRYLLGRWELPLAASLSASIVWTVWLLNLYNFMDGIDGLAGGEAALASLYFFFLFARHGEPAWAAANLFIAATSTGFLVHNWPPARVFMGDAGSGFLGAFYGMQSIVAALGTPIPFVVLVLPFSNFILDTTFTLVRRVWRKEPWYRAHRSHYYQRMTNLGMSHGKVTALELLAVAAGCLAAEGYLVLGPAGRVTVAGIILACAVACGYQVNRKERRLESLTS